MNWGKKIAALIILAVFGSGCVARGTLKRDLYPKTAESSPKSHARVVLVRRPGPPATLVHKELPLASAELDLTGYPRAVAALLASLYDQVSVATSAVEAERADFIVRLSTDYPRTVGLTFLDAEGTALASFSRPGLEVSDNPDAHSLLAKILMPPAAVVSFGTIGIGFAYRALQSRDEIAGQLSAATRKDLTELRAEIASSPLLRRGLEPVPAATPSGACAKALSDEQVPSAAKEFFSRGRSFLELARSEQDYGAAADELEKAAALAPCWPAVHFSSGLADEGASRWHQAAAHLRAYLALTGSSPQEGRLRHHIKDLEGRE